MRTRSLTLGALLSIQWLTPEGPQCSFHRMLPCHVPKGGRRFVSEFPRRLGNFRQMFLQACLADRAGTD
eukprot:616852-Amphidinium_carterae.2